jgi:hypothetical protein
MSSSPTDLVARVRRGDFGAMFSILTKSFYTSSGGKLFAAGLTDAVLCHFEPFDEVI